MRKQWPKRRDTFVVVYETILHVSNIYIVHAWFAYILHTETTYSGLYFVSVICTATTYSIVIALVLYDLVWNRTSDTYWLEFLCRGALSLLLLLYFFLYLVHCSHCVLFCLCRWSVIYNGTHDKSSAQYWIVVHDAPKGISWHFYTHTCYGSKKKPTNPVWATTTTENYAM